MEALRWILLLAGAGLIAAIYWRGRQQERATGGDSLFERARRGLSRDGRDAETASRVDPDMELDDDDLREFDFDTGTTAEREPQPRPPEAPAAEPEPRRPEAPAPEPGPAPGVEPAAEAAPPEDTTPESAATDAPEAPGTAGDDARSGAGEGSSSADTGPIRPSTQRVVVLYVVASAGERLVGSRLLEALESRGLRHGAYAIFHAGDSEGSTVFSVANAVDPGTFDRSTMDTLSTPGVAFFLQVPGPQAAETAFDRMLQTARGVADDLEARVLDEQHSTLTRQTEQHLREELRLIDRRTGQS